MIQNLAPLELERAPRRRLLLSSPKQGKRGFRIRTVVQKPVQFMQEVNKAQDAKKTQTREGFDHGL